MNLSRFCSVLKFIEKGLEFIETKFPDDKEIDIPSESTVAKAFQVSNPYLGVTLSSVRLNAVRVISQCQVHKSHVEERACNVICRIPKDRLYSLTQMINNRMKRIFVC